ncbi:Lrp/AsnC family transcriptional regulator [Mycolicibacterium brumae]|uniref:Lrp/AsnC family transcriptional regulator n=1 Tax=Mycolicibacterium brumae TaxID=85968 RepID=UPI0021F26BBD|nr:Lrp/AsnC family transcriptional regulator [Mycolicibacterium brumae]MCV7191273.1 Lrp/AsnC family transcriptional regulator [Mycolicibacterium brumae]
MPARQAMLRPPPPQRNRNEISESRWKPTPAIDDTDRALARELLSNAKISNRALASKVGISDSAVSQRLRKLTTLGALVFTAVIDWERAGFEWWVIALVKTRRRPAAEVAIDIGALPQCISTATVIGSHDLLGYFLVRDRAELRAVVDRLRSIDGVTEVDVELATDTRVTPLGRQLFRAVDPAPILLPAPCVDLDTLDLAILQELINDGRRSNRSIGRALQVSEATVRTRLARMTDSGLVQVLAMIDPAAFELSMLQATIMVRADRARIEAIAEEFLKLPAVAFVGICLGNWDLQVSVLVADQAELTAFIDSAAHSIDGVRETDTLLFQDIMRFNPCLKRVAGWNSVA